MPKTDSLAQLHAATVKNKLKHLILSVPEKSVVCVEVISIFNLILKLLLWKILCNLFLELAGFLVYWVI